MGGRRRGGEFEKGEVREVGCRIWMRGKSKSKARGTHESVEADLHEARREIGVRDHEQHRALRLVRRARVRHHIALQVAQGGGHLGRVWCPWKLNFKLNRDYGRNRCRFHGRRLHELNEPRFAAVILA